MYTVFSKYPADYNCQIIDSSNNRVDLSLVSSITLTLTRATAGASIGPIVGSISPILGHVTFPLSASQLKDVGVYSSSITYVIAGITTVTFAKSLTVVEKPAPEQFVVVSGQTSLVEFVITDTEGSPMNLTGVASLLFVTTSHSVAPTNQALTIVDAVNGVVSSSFTLTSTLFGYFTLDGILTTEFQITAVTS